MGLQYTPLDEDRIKLGRKTKAHRALGVDQLHPRCFSNASQPVRKAAAQLLNKIEHKGHWPDLIDLVRMELILKDDGREVRRAEHEVREYEPSLDRSPAYEKWLEKRELR